METKRSVDKETERLEETARFTESLYPPPVSWFEKFCDFFSSVFKFLAKAFDFLSPLLNLIPGEPNRLYRSLMDNQEGRRLRRSPWTWVHAALAVPLALPALLLSAAGLLLPVGNTVRFYCRKLSPAAEKPAAEPSVESTAQSAGTGGD